MAIKVKFFWLISLSFYCALCFGADPAKDPPRHIYTGSQYLKNYALSICLADGLEGKAAKQEAVDAARGYLELGSYSIDAYQAAADLAQQFLAKKYLAQHGEKLTVMKCVDLFHSNELKQLLKKYSGKR